MAGSKGQHIKFFLFCSLFVLLFSAPLQADQTSLSGLNLKEFNQQTKQQVEWQNNPFVRPANEVAVGELALTGIAISSNKAAAIINDQIVLVGDKIGSHEVVSIEKEGFVVLRTESGLFRLKLRGGQ